MSIPTFICKVMHSCSKSCLTNGYSNNILLSTNAVKFAITYFLLENCPLIYYGDS